MKNELKTLIAGVSLLGASAAMAGGPLANCGDGVPFRWSTESPVIFNPDQGDLGPLNNIDATQQVDDAFQQWENVGTATISYEPGAPLPVDVDITNFGQYLDNAVPDGLSAIVYDDTGEIFELIYGPGSGILGFAGPEFGITATCTITEGLAFLNGPAFGDAQASFDVMVHEFGHFSNLAHVQVNGNIVNGDNNGPGADVYPPASPADLFFGDVIETMYPFYFGPTGIPGMGTASLEKDDEISLSSLYPSEDFASGSVTIEGSVFLPNGETPLSGVNVIARNVDNPYEDATGILTGALTDETSASFSDVVGRFSITGLTPGATYEVFIDEIGPGGFSTPPVLFSPSPEEFYSGALESNSDDPLLSESISGNAGDVISNVDIILNQLQPGDPINTGLFGDDGAEIATPFPIYFCGEEYNTVWINGNGNISFGAQNIDFSESDGDHLFGPPRIAGHWRDLSSFFGGIVTFDTDGSTYFEAIWEDVPELGFDFLQGFFPIGSNSFSIRISKPSGNSGPKRGNKFEIRRGDISATAGLSGFSCGGTLTSGLEEETDLSRKRGRIGQDTAVFEQFLGTEGEETDVSGKKNRFRGVGELEDRFEMAYRGEDDDDDDDDDDNGSRTSDNNSVADATRIKAPFANVDRLAKLEAGDIDFYKFKVKADDIVAIEVVRGPIDSLIGLFDADTGDLIFADDDGGNGLLSRILLQFNVDLNLAVAVTSFPDFGFTGNGFSTGAYVLSVNTYQGDVLFLGDDDSQVVELPNGFRFQGEKYDSVNLNSNGNLTFLAGDPFGFVESADELVNGPPRIATLWDDLNPAGGGFFGSSGLYIVDNDKESTTIHGVSIAEFFSSSPNYFSVELEEEGEIELSYGVTARSDALVGISEGGGAADPGETNLSRLDDEEAGGTIYETFTVGATTTSFSDFDLIDDEVEFEEGDDDDDDDDDD
ncbi:MAG: carboxypeptidase-like regulatory domain-containing protein [Woeseiaceae bacterium]|nr:carboxypeptidase-like regulatory domain-containing protein [Woeseiaceae bacterium]